MKSICVFTGANPGTRPEFAETARETGMALAQAGITLVYGGAASGCMGLIADAALAHGGTVIGVITEYLLDKEIAHTGLTRLHVVDDMHQRKDLMAELSDGFMALPGGMGTLDELFEMLTWSQLRLHAKPCGLVNTLGYYDRLAAFLDHATDNGFIRAPHRNMLLMADTPAELIEQFAAYEHQVVEKWIKKPAN